MQGVEAAQSLDRAHGAAPGLESQHETARHRLAVEMHGARAAIAGAAAFLGPRQLEILAERIQ